MLTNYEYVPLRPLRDNTKLLKLSHKFYTYAMETSTKKVQVASQTNLADKELQKIVSPYFRNVKRCCSVTVGCGASCKLESVGRLSPFLRVIGMHGFKS